MARVHPLSHLSDRVVVAVPHDIVPDVKKARSYFGTTLSFVAVGDENLLIKVCDLLSGDRAS